jgi:hypothetical protein
MPAKHRTTDIDVRFHCPRALAALVLIASALAVS